MIVDDLSLLYYVVLEVVDEDCELCFILMMLLGGLKFYVCVYVLFFKVFIIIKNEVMIIVVMLLFIGEVICYVGV